MSRTRSYSTIFGASAALAVVCWLVTSVVPLRAAPQVVDAPGVTVDTGGAALLHRTPVAFPQPAAGPQEAGLVVAQVKLDAEGNVVDGMILSGPEALRRSVLQSVLGWHFAKAAGGSTLQVSVRYQPESGVAPKMVLVTPVTATPENRRLRTIDVVGLPQAASREVMAALPVRTGDTLTPETVQQVATAARKVDQHLNVAIRAEGEDANMTITAPGAPPQASGAPPNPGAVRIGAVVAQAKRRISVPPPYPPLAKAARVQGVVSFETTIGKDGRVENLRVISGPPLLVAAAMESVRQWVYEPTLLNGLPVEVLTTVDVTFTLAP